MSTFECQVCGASPAPLCCPGCAAMRYCSEKHMRRHLRLGHDEECRRMSLQMGRAQVMRLDRRHVKSCRAMLASR